MGQALATTLLRSGRPTVIWNRTASKAAGLVEQGALLAPSAAEAIRQASTAVLCVRDYAAVDAILPDRSDTVLVNLTSGHAAQARATAERDLPYLDGAILSPAPAIGTPAASILCAGPRALFERAHPVLGEFAANTIYAGSDPGAAAAYDTALLDLFATSVGGLVHAFAMAAAEGIDPRRFAPLAKPIAGLLTEQIDRFADQLAEKRFPASISSIASLASTTGHLVEAADAHGIDAAALRALRDLADRAVAAGHGDSGYAALSRALAS